MWQRYTDELTPQSWNRFVETHGPLSGRFLQSWEWGEFLGAERWLLREDETGQKMLVGVASIVYKTIPGFGRYAYCPRGPIVKNQQSFPELDSILFFRFDPPKDLAHGFGIKTSPVQPPMTRITDLQQNEDEMFASLHPKTRYNIRLADRHGVHVRTDLRDFDSVWPLFTSTSARGDFRLHAKVHYARMLKQLNDHQHGARAFLASAWYEDRPVAANIMVDFAGVRTYLHGASSYESRHVMAPHLLHWKLMNDARQNGLTYYDWWGVGPEDDPHHPWAGVSRFKRSFPGEDMSYPGTYDLVKKPFGYRLYRLVRSLRRAL